jgi:branched-chain amino acid transport system ATP-binding protein
MSSEPIASAAAAAPILEVEGIGKRFGGLTALSGVGFSIAAGEIYGLIGPNGAGKTTLFNVLTGIYRQDEGSIRFQGAALADPAPDRIASLGIARTFQNIRLFGAMSALDNVLVGMHTRLKATPLGRGKPRSPWDRAGPGLGCPRRSWCRGRARSPGQRSP